MKAFLQFTLKDIYRFFTQKEYRTFLRLLLIYGSRKRFIPCTINFNGYKFTVPDAPSFVWQYKEIFADKSYTFDLGAERPVIYDCGANVGLSCLYFSKQFPQARILAFEADSTVAEYLKKNLLSNKIVNVEVINKAVWINDETVSFFAEGADGGSIITADNNAIKIPSARLRSLLEKETAVDMMKMDIEGAEAQVLMDCNEQLSKCKHLFVEYHDYKNSNQQLGSLISLLEKNNFRYYIEGVRHRKSPLRTQQKPGTMDLQLNIYAVNRKDT